MFILGFSHILVIGGNQKQTEVIDLTDFSLTCTSAFGELDSIRKHAVGELINGIKPQSPLTKSPRQNHPARITPPESPLNLDHPCPKSPLPKITPATITPGHNHP